MRMIPFLSGIALLFAQCALGVRSSVPPAPPAPTPSGSTTRSFSVADLLKNQHHRRQTVDIENDAFFKTSKRYSAVPLRPWLDSVLAHTRFDTANAVVVFECGDHYQPTMLLSEVLGEKSAFVAFADHDAPAGKAWLDKVADKFAPTYLVWKGVGSGGHYVWPYGLTTIRLMSVAEEFKTVFPSDNLGLQRGFHLFRENCMKCHALNHIGGGMGPEFNIPKNITEYWREADIMAFAQNPSAYRANSKMPAMPHLKAEELQEIVRYLRYMTTRKV